jgi:hypothetical protein
MIDATALNRDKRRPENDKNTAMTPAPTSQGPTTPAQFKLMGTRKRLLLGADQSSNGANQSPQS